MRRFHRPSGRHGAFRYAAQALEPRLLLKGNVLHWGGEANLTLSFAPDGTSIAGMESSLFSSLSAVSPEEQWQQTILRAFQTWAAETNADIGVVADGGQDFGTTGATRGDSRFGDIRIGAAPLAAGVFAMAIPSGDVLSGTWVGDVILNSNASIANLDELFAIALHEAGHVFGIEHSDDPSSPMHVHGITPITSLAAADQIAVRSLYGERQPDLNERSTDNDSMTKASQLRVNSVLGGAAGSAPSLAYGIVTMATDVDYFRFATPEGYQGPVTLRLRTAEISLLAPTLALYDAGGELLDEAVASGAQGDVLELTMDTTDLAGQLFIRVSSGRNDVFGVGGYSLLAVFDDVNEVDDETVAKATDGSLRFLPQNEIAKVFRQGGDGPPPNYNDDGHTDDSPSASVRLTSAPGFAPQTRYETFGGVADANDVDYYRVTSPASNGGVMTVRVQLLENGRLLPAVRAFGTSGEELSGQVIVNDASEFVIQFYGIGSHENVTFSVAAISPAGPFSVGNYQLTVDFDDDAVELVDIVSDTITVSQPIRDSTLYVAVPQLMQFMVAVPGIGGSASGVVILSIRDQSGQIVHRLAAQPGETRTAGSVMLNPGVYHVQVVGLALETAPSTLAFALSAFVSSLPFSADPDDPTFQPEFQCDEPEHAGLYCYPGHFVSADPYLWEDFVATVPESSPELSYQQWVQSLLGQWWSWLWVQAGLDGPPLARSDVLHLPDGPQSQTDSQSAAALNVLDNDIEPESQSVTAVLRSPPAGGQLTLNEDGTLEYVPAAGFEGVDTFTYVATDSVNESNEAKVRIVVGFLGDYDGNNVIDGADLLPWQRSYGQSVAPGSGADGDGDGVVSLFDAVIWSLNLGRSRPAPLEATYGELSLAAEVSLELELAPTGLPDFHYASASPIADRATAPSLCVRPLAVTAPLRLPVTLASSETASPKLRNTQRPMHRPALREWHDAVDEALSELLSESGAESSGDMAGRLP